MTFAHFKSVGIQYLDLCREEFNKPAVIHGSRFIFRDPTLIVLRGNAISNGCLYKFINHEYASLGQSICRIGERSMRLSSDLNFDIFSSEKEHMCLNCGVFFWVVVEM